MLLLRWRRHIFLRGDPKSELLVSIFLNLTWCQWFKALRDLSNLAEVKISHSVVQSFFEVTELVEKNVGRFSHDVCFRHLSQYWVIEEVPLAWSIIFAKSCVVSHIEVSIVIYDSLEIINESVVLLVEHVWAHVETVNRETDLVVHLLIKSDVLSLKSVETEYQDWRRFVDLHLLVSIDMLFAVAAEPRVIWPKSLSSSELLQAFVNGLLNLHIVLIGSLGEHSWMRHIFS